MDGLTRRGWMLLSLGVLAAGGCKQTNRMPAPPRYSDQGGIPSAPGALPLPSTELGSDAPNLNNTPYGTMSQGGTMAPSGEIPAGYPAPSGIHQPAAPANADATAPIGGLPDLGAPQQ